MNSGKEDPAAAAVSFARDIKPFFTDTDQDHMLNDVGMFDLYKASDVCENYTAIREAIQDKRMPIPDPWPDDKIDKFLPLFDAWQAGGCQA